MAKIKGILGGNFIMIGSDRIMLDNIYNLKIKGSNLIFHYMGEGNMIYGCDIIIDNIELFKNKISYFKSKSI